MASTRTTDRRAFLKSSAFAAAPLAAVAVPAAALASDDGAAKLARIEDERAIETAHRTFLRRPDAGKLRSRPRKGETIERIEPDAGADPAPPEFSDDGRRATTRRPCTVHLASEHTGDTTLEQMARLQGNAATRQSRPCVILAEYRKEHDTWTLASADIV